MEMKNCGTVENALVGVGQLNLAQLNRICRKHHSQNFSFRLAVTLLRIEPREMSPMRLYNDQKADLQDIPRQQPECQIEAEGETPADLSRPVIVLGDLTTGAEAEVSRLKSSMIALSAEFSQIRGEQAVLASDYQKLTGELREIKLVLAKVHAKELRAIESRSSWMESLRLLREVFQKNRNQGTSQGAKSRVSSLRK
jgi:hypothetical protein